MNDGAMTGLVLDVLDVRSEVAVAAVVVKKLLGMNRNDVASDGIHVHVDLSRRADSQSIGLLQTAVQ